MASPITSHLEEKKEDLDNEKCVKPLPLSYIYYLCTIFVATKQNKTKDHLDSSHIYLIYFEIEVSIIP